MKRAIAAAFLICVVAALSIGLWLGSRNKEPSTYEMERTAMSLQMARSLLPFQVAFRVLLGGVFLLTLGGLGWGVVRWLNYRVSTLYPNHAGLYPVREAQLGQARVFHDPNRAATATTVYAHGLPDLTVQHPLPQGHANAQWQVTSQAQATQALRAAVSGHAPLPAGPQISMDMFDQRRLSRPLPEVAALDIEPSHIERLLAESTHG